MKTARTEGSTVFDRDFVSAILTWSDSNPRSLPWRVDGARERRDPWSVLVAETMLAQTQATRVAQVYPSFLERFPTALAMAQSTKSEVLERWIGLGYYRRAVRLWESSRAVVSNYPNSFPATLAELLQLPGVGRYTACAVLALGFGEAVVPVDVNALRVARRAIAGSALTHAETQQLLDRLVPPDRPAAFAEALFDLGSQYCTAQAPRCSQCPLSDRYCVWQRGLRRRSVGGRCDQEPSPVVDPALDPANPGSGRPRVPPYRGSRRHLRALVLRSLLQGRGLLDREVLFENVAALLNDSDSRDGSSRSLGPSVSLPTTTELFGEALRDLVSEGFVIETEDGLQLAP